MVRLLSPPISPGHVTARLAAIVLCLTVGPGAGAQTVDLDRIMADPDWIGRAPQRPYWAADGNRVFFSQKRLGAEAVDTVSIDLAGGEPSIVPDTDLGSIDDADGDYDTSGQRKVYSHLGDVYLRDLASGELFQLTRTAEREHSPFFLTDESRIAFQRGEAFLVRDLSSGLEWQPFELVTSDDPAAEEEDQDYLSRQQKRLFDTIRKQLNDEETQRQEERRRRLVDPRRSDPTWYLGDDTEIVRSALSPTGDWLAVVVADEAAEARRDTLPHFVSRDGYVENEEVRVKVGHAPQAERLLLLQASTRTTWKPDLAVLPGIEDDPLAAIKAEREDEAAPAVDDSGNEQSSAVTAADSAQRPLLIPDLAWSPDGSQLVVQAFSIDNKDRWIATVDLVTGQLQVLEHFHDEAWINDFFSDLGWLPDSHSFYLLSEESGYSHLYVREAAKGGARRALTSGAWEVAPRIGSSSRPYLTRDGRLLYFTANREHPGIVEVYRVDTSSAEIERLTDLGGVTDFVLSPDENSLLLLHSTRTRPPEIYVQSARPGTMPRRLTHTVSDTFTALPWVEPLVVAVPSSFVDRPIYSRLYLPQASATASDSRRPAVVFVHGAGYLQNAHMGWSSYFREFMFHTLLTQRGYVVLDMDYRASAGYGRDWRTAIYRRMGTPELEDLKDGVAWLVDRHGVDPQRVGVYGGSYGGFMTLMALFKEPDLFAAGAALRPVTDWSHYNHGYTSNILNTPEVDPEAYERSSPIEFAAGLSKPLLMCHGVLDDNVLFEDTARLAQRLIELGKRDWEVAIFPVERHGFRQPSSWLDEYRRVLRLFETYVR